MAKRKTKIETAADDTPAERVHKAGGQAEVANSERWEILYTPQWRPELDYGIFPGSIEDAQAQAQMYVQSAVFHLCPGDWLAKDRTPQLDWEQVEDNTWIATGNDGVQETTLPLVTITRVTEE